MAKKFEVYYYFKEDNGSSTKKEVFTAKNIEDLQDKIYQEWLSNSELIDEESDEIYPEADLGYSMGDIVTKNGEYHMSMYYDSDESVCDFVAKEIKK